MTVNELIQSVGKILEDIPDSDFDRVCILEDIAGISRESAATHPDADVSQSLCQKTLTAANTRALGYPLQYILGRWEFYGLVFKVGEGVLIPRADTEVLVDTAVDKLRKAYLGKTLNVLDLCSGSGCVAVAIAKTLGDMVNITAVELSGDAFPYLAENVRANSVSVRLFRGDVMNGGMLDNFCGQDNDDDFPTEYMDCIVCNPPYLTDDEMSHLQREITFEPETALYGGIDGLKFFRVISCMWKNLLRSGGMLIFEVGDSQCDSVEKILADNGFTDIFTAKDGAGITRVVGGILP